VSAATLRALRHRRRVIRASDHDGNDLLWLSLSVLIPLRRAVLKTTEPSLDRFVTIVTRRGCCMPGAVVRNGVMEAAVNLRLGAAVVWAMVRYAVPRPAAVDAVVDIPFRRCHGVAGIGADQSLCGEPAGSAESWRRSAARGVNAARIFVAPQLRRVALRGGRTVQPVLEDLGPSWRRRPRPWEPRGMTTIRRVVAALDPAGMLTGLRSAFATGGRAEYGAVIFIEAICQHLGNAPPLMSSGSRSSVMPTPPRSPRSCWSRRLSSDGEQSAAALAERAPEAPVDRPADHYPKRAPKAARLERVHDLSKSNTGADARADPAPMRWAVISIAIAS